MASLKNQFNELYQMVSYYAEQKNEAFKSINPQGSPSRNSTSLGISPMPQAHPVQNNISTNINTDFEH
jgi:hypothetical protein